MTHRQQAHPVRQFVRQSMLTVISTGIVTKLRFDQIDYEILTDVIATV